MFGITKIEWSFFFLFCELKNKGLEKEKQQESCLNMVRITYAITTREINKVTK